LRAPLLLVAWLTVIIIGFAAVLRYETTPGIKSQPPTIWPNCTTIKREPNSSTLILAVHPHCPCTRATLSELSEIMSHTQNRLRAYVLFLSPSDFAPGWEKTDLWYSAKSIPQTTVISDINGAESARFNCATSGQALVYDAKGTLRFNGGITSARGHQGDNAGRDAIVALARSGSADREQTLVFGCALKNSNPNRKPEECQNLQTAP